MVKAPNIRFKEFILAKRLVAFIILLSLAVTGCSVVSVGRAASVKLVFAQNKPLGRALDDAAVDSAIRRNLRKDKEKRFKGVDVSVENGLVLLTGNVSSVADRLAAEQIAWKPTAVNQVANEIVVSRPDGVLPDISDYYLSSRVRLALFGTGGVKSSNYNIEIHNGVVYLLGVARTNEELLKATEIVSKVSGVKKVVSYVRVSRPKPE